MFEREKKLQQVKMIDSTTSTIMIKLLPVQTVSPLLLKYAKQYSSCSSVYTAINGVTGTTDRHLDI